MIKPLVKTDRWRSGDVVLEATTTFTVGHTHLRVDWIRTKPGRRRCGKATEVLRQFRRQQLRLYPGAKLTVSAIITGKAVYRLFRKVFGRPRSIVDEDGVRRVEGMIANQLEMPMLSRASKDNQIRQNETYVEVTWALAKKELRQ